MRQPALVPISMALHYCIGREWKAPDLGDENPDDIYEATMQELEQLARKDTLTLYGKIHKEAGPHLPIPARAWNEVRVERQSVFTDCANTKYQKEKPVYAYPNYFLLAADKNQLVRLFPPIGWFGKLIRSLKRKKRASTSS